MQSHDVHGSGKGTVPIVEMFGYEAPLRSRSQGRGTYSLKPHHYPPLPEKTQEQLFGGLEL